MRIYDYKLSSILIIIPTYQQPQNKRGEKGEN